MSFLYCNLQKCKAQHFLTLSMKQRWEWEAIHIYGIKFACLHTAHIWLEISRCGSQHGLMYYYTCPLITARHQNHYGNATHLVIRKVFSWIFNSICLFFFFLPILALSVQNTHDSKSIKNMRVDCLQSAQFSFIKIHGIYEKTSINLSLDKEETIRLNCGKTASLRGDYGSRCEDHCNKIQGT